MLRDAVKQGTQAGVAAKTYMDKGVLVPDHVLIDMFRERLTSESIVLKALFSTAFRAILPRREISIRLLES